MTTHEQQSNSQYEHALIAIRRETGANAVILIFDRGEGGIDFSVQAMGELTASLPEYLDDLSAKLREMRRRGLDG